MSQLPPSRKRPKSPTAQPEPVVDSIHDETSGLTDKQIAELAEKTAVKAIEKLTPEPEPEIVAKTRAMIVEQLKKLEVVHGKPMIGLALAIVAQETGSFEVANRLISEYGLRKLYGIKKRDS